jgi:hypothetical protein
MLDPVAGELFHAGLIFLLLSLLVSTLVPSLGLIIYWPEIKLF